MASPATITDLKERSFRPLTEPEQQVGEVLLEDAWNLIVTNRPHAADRSSEPTYLALVKQIQCAMVLRVIKNPDGFQSEQLDDWMGRRDAALSTGELYLSNGELVLLGSSAGSSEGAWTINTRPPGIGAGYWSTTDTWVPM